MKKIDNRTFSVYMHTLPDGRVYVGMTSQKPEVRWLEGEGYKGNSAFYEAIQEEGWENIEHEIVETGLSKAEAAELEKELIIQFDSTDLAFGFNVREGGECHSFGRGKSLFCLETKKLYSNSIAAAHDLGLVPSAMSHDGKHRGMTFVEMDEDEAEQYLMFEELSDYTSLHDISADELTDDICSLLFGE